MNLKYKILWIENEVDWVESIEDQIQDYIESLGFAYEKNLIGKEEADVSYNDYDLILMDLNLADQPNGAELISKIRGLGVYTDVVFYSAAGLNELRAKGKDHELEGVYYSGRTPEASFIKKVKAVIDSTLKKVQDLANLRGLVMAEVSELDLKMEGIIRKHFVEEATEESKKEFFKHVVLKAEENAKRSLKGCDNQSCSHIWKQMDINEIIPKMDSSQKARAVNSLITTDIYKPTNKNFYEDYLNEIINVRNNLAHCVSIKSGNQEVLKTRKGDLSYNDNDICAIRNNIKKYSVLFDKL